MFCMETLQTLVSFQQGYFAVPAKSFETTSNDYPGTYKGICKDCEVAATAISAPKV